ncbi:hypothetical protein [Gilvimarinus xylanilyticus]|uniref:Uncharacterized protein n=1 Tax=Gilvimarinus xylanilyticus TaxID=2944139 RepID=A0A9X2HUP0_9GAMM|nr:hypothetical protein [Gilvimarinus xylanilyticus]MCP8898540.1 hypothetical protein [Gilvimarinus xylanilyticus]
MKIHSAEVPERFLLDIAKAGHSELSALQFSHFAFYLAEPELIHLIAVVGMGQCGLQACLLEESEATRAFVEQMSPGAALGELEQWFDTPVLYIERAVSLLPVTIPKPWGREIWFTGMEARGVARVGDESRSIPLPWLLALAPQRFSAGAPEQLTLLKILDPLPDEVYGDLYFEMHEHKQEVYVVTHVDERAWPEGQGGIRYGFNQAQRSQYGNDDAFKQAYLKAVQDYERVRRHIDERLDQLKRAAGVAISDPVPPESLNAWMEQLPADLQHQELQLRRAMESFIQVMPLSVGDVVQVPCHTPHSLLHGVRTVEFQTPVYERKILSFAQKVLTQSHWDTEEALQNVALDAAEQSLGEEFCPVEGLKAQKIVDFSDFEVWRYSAEQACELSLARQSRYQLLMSIGTGVSYAGQALAAEQSFLVPAGARPTANLAFTAGAVALIAIPRIGDC